MALWKPYPIVGGAYSDDTKPWSVQDTVNYLPVRIERAGGRSNELLRSAPGGSLFAALGDGPIRGSRDVEGKLLVVSGRSLYQVFADSTWTLIGTIPGVGRVQMTHNQIAGGNQVVIANGISGYVYNTYTETLTQITDEAFPGFGSADFIAGYIAGVEPQGRYWFHSNLADALDYSSLDRYESEISPDLIVGLIETHGEVMVLSQKTCEFYANTGAATGTFQRQTGTSLEVGCASRHSIAKIDNSIIWLGNDGIVYRLNGYSALPISTGPMSQAISRCDMSRAFATVFDSRGHKIYYLTFPDGQTWGYDVTTQEWARRESYGLDRWRYNTLTRWNGAWIGGDYNSGSLLQLRWGYMREGVNPVVRSRSTGVLHDNQNPLTVNGLELVMDTGASIVEPALPRAALAITGALPDGVVGTAIASYTYTVTGGLPAYGARTISAGALPDGLAMDSAGTVTGTPTTAGTFAWTVSVTDANGDVATVSDTADVIALVWWLAFSGTTANEVWETTDPLTWPDMAARTPNVSAVYGLHRTATTVAAYSGTQAEVASDLDFAGGIATTLVTPTWPGGGLTPHMVSVSGVLFTLGSAGYSMSVDGGLTFTDHTIGGTRSLAAVARLTNGRWLAFVEPAADFGFFYYSDEAAPTAWTLATNASTVASPQYGIFSYGTGAFHIGNSGAVRRTTTGDAWDYTAGLVPLTYGNADIYGDTDGNGTWIISAKEFRQVLRTTDNGLTFALIAMPGGAIADQDAKIHYGNGVFVATFANKVFVSATGADGSWVEATLPVTGKGGTPKVVYVGATA